MRIVHAADVHMGAQRFERLTKGGRNLREADVARSWEAFVVAVCALDPKPDLILLAGDIFDGTRPNPKTLVEVFGGVQRLSAVAPVIMIDGNHETPKDLSKDGILPLLNRAGAPGRTIVVHREAKRIELPALDCAVLCVPERVSHQTKLTTTARGTNILLLHGEVMGAIPGSPGSPASIDREALREATWDYVALGHYHVTTEVAPMVWYAGAIDYTSSDIWRELRTEGERGLEGKGFLVVDTVAKTVVRHNLPRSRFIVDLPVIEAEGRTAEELDREIMENLEEFVPQGEDLPVVRQIVRGVSHTVKHDMRVPHDRELRAACCNLAIECRRADVPQTVALLRGHLAKRPTLPQLFDAKIATSMNVDDPADREALRSLGHQYLDQAAEQEAARGVA